MKLSISIIVFFLLAICTDSIHAQEIDRKNNKTAQRDSVNYNLRGTLTTTDSVKVAKVKLINALYRSQVNKLMSDQSLTASQKQNKIDVLLTSKNFTLRELLNVKELKELAPDAAMSAPEIGERAAKEIKQ